MQLLLYHATAFALCYCLFMLLPLHAAVNMHVGAVAGRGCSDHDGYAAFTPCVAFYSTFHSQVTLNLSQ